jgi:hypothetical protein
MTPTYAEGCRAEARLRDGGRADRVVDPAKVIKSYVATAKERRNIGSDSQKRSRISVTLDAEGFAPRDGERVRIGCGHALTNVAKEIYELAMRDGHDTEDFSTNIFLAIQTLRRLTKSRRLSRRHNFTKTEISAPIKIGERTVQNECRYFRVVRRGVSLAAADLFLWGA